MTLISYPFSAFFITSDDGSPKPRSALKRDLLALKRLARACEMLATLALTSGALVCVAGPILSAQYSVGHGIIFVMPVVYILAVLGISLGSLAGLPPSPLFASEVLIIAGGFEAGRPWSAAVAALLAGLGFLGLAHALIETLAGKRRGAKRGTAAGLRPVLILAAVATVLLFALAGAALVLPGSGIVDAFARGLR